MKDHPRSSSNFWFGMLMGTAVGAGGLFLLGTKKGRKYAKKILEAAENMEFVLEDVVSEFEVNTFDKSEELEEKAIEMGKKVKGSIETILDKITSHTKDPHVKRYFSKDGKILK